MAVRIDAGIDVCHTTYMTQTSTDAAAIKAGDLVTIGKGKAIWIVRHVGQSSVSVGRWNNGSPAKGGHYERATDLHVVK